MRCFYSHSFRAEDERVVDWFRRFLQAFPLIEVVEAVHHCPPPIELVTRLVKEAELFCAVVTGRAGSVPPWVSNEVGMARAAGKVIFAFVEDGIEASELGCIPAATAYLTFDRQHLGERSPAYVPYVLNARNTVLQARQEDRRSLKEQLDSALSLIQHYREAEERRQEEQEQSYNDSFVG